MIRAKRKGPTAPAFERPLVVRRCRGKIRLRLTFERRSTLGHVYKLELIGPKSGGRRIRALYRVIESPGGKWCLAELRERTAANSAPVPPAVYRELVAFMSELDMAARMVPPPAPPSPPPARRAPWQTPLDRTGLLPQAHTPHSHRKVTP